MMTMQPSLTVLKTEKFLACEQDLHQRDIEKSHAQVARKGKVRGKKGRALPFPTALSPTREFACHSIMERLPLGHKFFGIRSVRYSLS